MKLLAVTAALTIGTAAAVPCDFCPDPADLLSQDDTCHDLLRMARAGTLYTDEQECSFNIPILADRCLCSFGPEPVYDPCDPCEGKSTTAEEGAVDLQQEVDVNTYKSMTMAKVSGNVLFPFTRKSYTCVEALYSATTARQRVPSFEHLGCRRAFVLPQGSDPRRWSCLGVRRHKPGPVERCQWSIVLAWGSLQMLLCWKVLHRCLKPVQTVMLNLR